MLKHQAQPNLDKSVWNSGYGGAQKGSEPRRHELLELAPETRIQSVTEANLKSDFEGIERERDSSSSWEWVKMSARKPARLPQLLRKSRVSSVLRAANFLPQMGFDANASWAV